MSQAETFRSHMDRRIESYFRRRMDLYLAAAAELQDRFLPVISKIQPSPITFDGVELKIEWPKEYRDMIQLYEKELQRIANKIDG